MYEAQNIAFHDIAIAENSGWFFNIGYNAILKIDFKTGVISLEAMLPEYFWGMKEAFAGIEYYDGKLYLAPRNDFRLCIYSIQEKIFSFIEVDTEQYGEEHNYNLFNTVKAINNMIYYFPGRFHSIIKLNPSDLSLEYISYGYESIEETWEQDKSSLLVFNKIHFQQGKCLMPCWRSNIIVEFDIKNETSTVYRIEDDKCLADAVFYNENYICTFKDSDKVLKIDKHNGSKTEVATSSASDGTLILYKDGTIVLIPIFGQKINSYILSKKKNTVIYTYPDETEDNQEWLSYKNTSLCGKLIDNGIIISYSCKTGKIVLFDIVEEDYKEIDIKLSEEFKKTIKSQIGAKFAENLFVENEAYDLGKFVADLFEMEIQP